MSLYVKKKKKKIGENRATLIILIINSSICKIENPALALLKIQNIMKIVYLHINKEIQQVLLINPSICKIVEDPLLHQMILLNQENHEKLTLLKIKIISSIMNLVCNKSTHCKD